jgi:very-short-patch-repair endonuclease
MSRDFARQLRKNMTDAEQRLWSELRYRQLGGWKFRRQAPIGSYIADFVCFERKLIIELDGGQHAERAEYDERRSEWLASQGFRVLRFWNHQVFEETESIKEWIWQALGATCHPQYPPP